MHFLIVDRRSSSDSSSNSGMDTVTLTNGIYLFSMITFEKNDIKHELEKQYTTHTNLRYKSDSCQTILIFFCIIILRPDTPNDNYEISL